MAMIQLQPARIRGALVRALRRALTATLTGRRVAFAGGLVTLLMVLLFGLDPLLFWATSHHGYLLIPSSLGVPFLLPGLRFARFADESWAALGCEDFAALLMVLTVVRILARHRRTYPSSGRLHRFLVGWGALMLGGLLAGAFRGIAVARTVDGGPLAYFGYPALGAAFGVLWCLLLGWIPGLAAVFAVLPSAAVDRAREWWVESGRLILAYLLEPAVEQIRSWRGGGRAELALRRLDLTDDENHSARGDAAP
ncbi:hypothetical protein ACEZCY_28045 [Streptacidiphilus sp. N1-12]|uniref:Uncharacterized protein n=2 Tax=Streptacidiphilus alkalitolerans TaxID=3342712 RepID=A0ABV6VGJ0_9ACTN